jgi:hypothetical protein
VAKPPKVATVVGIGDNNIRFLTDPRFLALGIHYVRDDVPWDVLDNAYTRTRLGEWLTLAQQERLTPLITFDHSGATGRKHMLPSVALYAKLFLRFRALFPWVTEFVTWDESNFFNEPTAGDPKRVAEYYLALRHDCPTCTILATDLLDIPNPDFAVPMVKWAREFIRYAHVQPEYWGLNNYIGANDLSTASTRALLAAVRGKIWFAETAGVISDGAHAVEATAARLARQASADRFILERLTSLSPRIQRVYIYEWQAATAHDPWDSALISWTGVPRPAYYALADVLDSWGIKPDCAISRVPPACSGAG